MTFEQFLASTTADAETVHKALRLHLSELIGDLSPDVIREQLRAAVDDPALLEEGIGKLAVDSASVEEAALTYFGELWTDERQQPSIMASFAQANSQQPSMECALFAMYALFLVAIRSALAILCGGPSGTGLNCAPSAQTTSEHGKTDCRETRHSSALSACAASESFQSVPPLGQSGLACPELRL